MAQHPVGLVNSNIPWGEWTRFGGSGYEHNNNVYNLAFRSGVWKFAFIWHSPSSLFMIQYSVEWACFKFSWLADRISRHFDCCSFCFTYVSRFEYELSSKLGSWSNCLCLSCLFDMSVSNSRRYSPSIVVVFQWSIQVLLWIIIVVWLIVLLVWIRVWQWTDTIEMVKRVWKWTDTIVDWLPIVVVVIVIGVINHIVDWLTIDIIIVDKLSIYH